MEVAKVQRVAVWRDEGRGRRSKLATRLAKERLLLVWFRRAKGWVSLGSYLF